jgi:hypothetical protein
MSTAHRGEPKSEAELNRMLGEGDTPELAARPVKLNTSYGIGYGAGVSVDGKTIYIDHQLYEELCGGKIALPQGLDAVEVVKAWIDHEHTEWAIDVGDNPVDAYKAAHAFATTAEHRAISDAAGDPDRYEKAIRPALERCVARYPRNPPKDLWCGPYLDVAFGDDKNDANRAKAILRAYREQGVRDAFKVSKVEVHYGMSDVECRDCTMYESPGKPMSTCELVCGLVRQDRSCDRYEEK